MAFCRRSATRLLIVAILVILVSCRQTTKHKNKPITNGKRVPIKRVPFQSQILSEDYDFLCGATILEPCWILTAAHCLRDGKQPRKISSIIAGSNYSAEGIAYEVKRTIVHPEFGGNDILKYDVALMELQDCLELKEGQQSAVKLSTREPKANEMVKISGFGKTDPQRVLGSRYLYEAEVPVIDKEDCRQRYETIGHKIDDSVFCAGNGDADSCEGDSGGPAFTKDGLVGVISSGQECSDADFPSTYTRVDKIIGWITKETKLILNTTTSMLTKPPKRSPVIPRNRSKPSIVKNALPTH